MKLLTRASIRCIMEDLEEESKGLDPKNPSHGADHVRTVVDKVINKNQELQESSLGFDESDLPLINATGGGRADDDVRNSMALYRRLRISPAEATQVSLWITLSLIHYRSYINDRWGMYDLSRHKSVYKIMKDKCFMTKTGDTMQYNEISKLWWCAHMASKAEGHEQEEAVRLITEDEVNRDRLSRHAMFREGRILGTILDIIKEEKRKGTYKAWCIIEFLRICSEYNGPYSISSLGDSDRRELLDGFWKRALASPKKR